MPPAKHDKQLQRDLAAFGAAVMKARVARKLTQEQAAVEVGMGRSYYADVERGARNVSLRNLLRLCRAFEVKPGTLLDPLV